MSGTTTGASKGIFDSLTTLAGTLVGITHTRLDLLSADLDEERAHFFSLLVSSLVALFCLGIGVVLAMILLVIMFWDAHRLLSLGVIAGFFLACGSLAWVNATRKSRAKPRLFAASLSELAKDREQLKPRP